MDNEENYKSLTPAERLKLVRKTMGLTQQDMASMLKISQARYCFYEKNLDRQNIMASERFLQMIELTFHVNLGWLKTGNGEMFDNANNITTLNIADTEINDLIFKVARLPRRIYLAIVEMMDAFLEEVDK